MEDAPQYEREVSILRLASGREDLPRLEREISGWAEEYTAEKVGSWRSILSRWGRMK